MAEVKVKVTAQNETRTGFQQALNDAKQFGNEATRSVTMDDEAALAPLRKLQQQLRDVRTLASSPVQASEVDLGGGEEFASASTRGAAAIRGLATDLAGATSAGQVFEAIIKRISTAFGGLIAATAGFAIGSVIRRSLEDAASGLNDLIDRGEKLSETLSALSAPTTNFDQFASTLASVKTQIEDLQKATEAYKSSFSNIAVDFATQGGNNPLDALLAGAAPGAAFIKKIIDRFRGEQGALFDAADAGEEAKLGESRLAIRKAIAQQIANEVALSQQSTDEGRKQLAFEQERLKERKRLEATLKEAKAPQEEISRNLSQFDRLTQLKPDREAADRERSLQAQADKQRAINEDNKRSLEDRLSREKQGLADLEQFGGAGVELQREQAVSRIADLERQIASEKERAASKAKSTITAALQVTGLESVAQLKQTLESVDAKTIQLALEATGLDSVEELQSALSQANNQTITAALQVTGLETIEELRAALDSADSKRVQVLFEALGVESIDEAKATLDSLDAQARNSLDAAARKKRDSASQSIAAAIEERQFAGLSPAEKQAKIAADQAALITGVESGAISPADAAQRALELARREDALSGGTGGFAGSSGASSLQRIGFASDEFFNTRTRKDPAEATEKAVRVLQEIKNALERSEPLVLNPT
jgi:uncharacterized protein (DUF697 family)